MRWSRTTLWIGSILWTVSSAFPQGMDITGIAERAKRLYAPDSSFDVRSFLEQVRTDTSMRTAFRNVLLSSHGFYGHFEVSKWKRYGDRRNMIQWEGRYVLEGDSSYFVIDSIRCKGVFRRRERKRSYYIEDRVLDILSGYSWLSENLGVALPQKRFIKNSHTAIAGEHMLRILDGQYSDSFGQNVPRYYDLFDSSATKKFNYKITSDCRFCSEPSYCLEMQAVPYAWKHMDWWGFGDICFEQNTRQLIYRQGFLSMDDNYFSFLVENERRGSSVVPRYIYCNGSLPVGNYSKEHFTLAFGIRD